MITVIALNPSIDLTNYIDGFDYGGLNRTVKSRLDAGGKGLNVALALATLGSQTVCAGFMHTDNANMFADKLRRGDAGYDFVYLKGHTRTNVKVVNIQDGITTEINQSGDPVPENCVESMDELCEKHARRSDYMIFTGSTPPGIDSGYYAKLIRIANSHGCRCVLDADGSRLQSGIESIPYMIKPNRFELEQLIGEKIVTLNDIKAASLKLIQKGIGVVAVSMGADGAFITDGKSSYFCKAYRINVRSTVGAGDSMVAALTHSLSCGETLLDAFASGVAASAAACLVEGTDMFDINTYEKLKREAEIIAV